MLDQLTAEIRKEFPDFNIVRKRDSTLMKVISVFLAIITFGLMRVFMTGFYTTLGDTIYVPDGWDTASEQSKCATLRHERVHMRQARKYTRFLFSFSYVFVFLPGGLSFFRMKFEKEAYEETIRAWYEYGGAVVIQNYAFREDMIKHFVTSQYVWMWPFRKNIETWYDDAVEKVLNPKA